MLNFVSILIAFGLKKTIMKIKSYLATTLFAAMLFSCTKENEAEVKPVAESQVLNFDSEKTMQNKIAEIEAFKKEQEAQIIQKLLQRNNLKAPTEDDFLNAQKTSKSNLVDQKAVLEDLKFYHTEKLKAIAAERTHFGFTSIQSVADEINSLKLINPNASKLLYKYSTLLTSSGILTKSIFNDSKSLILNTKDEVQINKAKTKQNIQSRFILDNPNSIKEGVLATNGYYTITWHVGVSEHKDDLIHTYFGNFTQFGSFVNNSLYPSWFFPTTNSAQKFIKPGTLNPILDRIVHFPTSAGNIVRNDDANSISRDYWSSYYPAEGYVSGNFVTIINGQYIIINGVKNI
jgi:hypothetical protein